MQPSRFPGKRSWFTSFASRTSELSGHPLTFLFAALIVIVWGALGPVFGFSNTWQLVINTGTTIVTFLMVFLIQNTQSRDTHALQIKLDELIRANRLADNALLDVEELDEKELCLLRDEFEALAAKARTKADRRKHVKKVDPDQIEPREIA
jgi:low affinity Fe/Cu permease